MTSPLRASAGELVFFVKAEKESVRNGRAMCTEPLGALRAPSVANVGQTAHTRGIVSTTCWANRARDEASKLRASSVFAPPVAGKGLGRRKKAVAVTARKSEEATRCRESIGGVAVKDRLGKMQGLYCMGPNRLGSEGLPRSRVEEKGAQVGGGQPPVPGDHHNPWQRGAPRE